MATDLRDRFEKRRSALKQERRPFDDRAREIAEFGFPELGRFTTYDKKKAGTKQRQNIINNRLSRAALVLRAGMLAGITSPIRPWLRVTTVDTDLAKFQPVRTWLDAVSKRQLQQFGISNTYRALGSVYMENGLFGTNVLWQDEDEQDEFRFHNTTWGEFMLGANSRNQIDTCYREYSMTVWALVDRFGLENVSGPVKNMYDKGQTETLVDVVHVCEPHMEDIEGVEFKLRKFPYRSVYYERGAARGDKFLEAKGYKRKPFFGARWETVSNDTYAAWCPGVISLGDNMELQHHEFVKARAIDLMTQPPMLTPANMKKSPLNIGPGGRTTYNPQDGDAGVKPLFQMNFNVDHSKLSILELEERIDQSFHVDLFRTVMDVRARSVNTQITAREVDQLEKEGLIQLGPVLESHDDELLDPLVESTFQIQLENGDYPPPPREMVGQALRVEYLSTIHQAQKLVGLQPFDRVTQFASGIVQMTGDTAIFDLLDNDQSIRDYADLAGYPPDLVRDENAVYEIREQRAAQMQQMQAAQAAASAASTAKDAASAGKSASETPVSGDNALSRILEYSRGAA